MVPNLFGDSGPDAVPDVIVCDEGSDDVYVLLGSGTGSNRTLTKGKRLQTGVAPVSVTVADVTGPDSKPDGIPDLIVTNSGSNTVSNLPGVGDANFDAVNPLIYPAGTNPQQALVGNFDGHPDLVILDAGSNELTLYSNCLQAGPGATPQLLSGGGSGPVAAVEGEFRSGTEDLVVANSNSSSYALLVGGLSGLTVSQVVSSPDDSVLEVASLYDSQQDDDRVYGLAEGANAASLLFTFAISAAETETEPAVGFNLLPLVNSTLAVVATLVAAPDSDLTLQSTSGLRTTTNTPFSTIAVTGVGSGGLDADDAGPGGELAAEIEQGQSHGFGTSVPGGLPLFNYLLEIEQMLEENASRASRPVARRQCRASVSMAARPSSDSKLS